MVALTNLSDSTVTIKKGDMKWKKMFGI
jgi:hypothetical protein